MKPVLIAMMLALMARQTAPPPVNTGSIRGLVARSGTTTGIADVSIAISINGRATTGGPINVKTDATGNFVVRDIPSGSWIVMAERDGYIPSVDGSSERAIVAVAAQTPTSVTLHLTQAG